IYHGPLTKVIRRAKIFSLSSLALTTLASPVMFVLADISVLGRLSLVGTCFAASALSTAMIAVFARPYVTTFRKLYPREEKASTSPIIELTNNNLFLQPTTTRVYDHQFIVQSARSLCTWELAKNVQVPKDTVTPGQEETVAETFDPSGVLLGRWIVRWDEDGQGECYEVGRVHR
ncbi:hypothetical protein FISHEDRAFT_31733, partial [Fistulina hepatica ATCC 64428]